MAMPKGRHARFLTCEMQVSSSSSAEVTDNHFSKVRIASDDSVDRFSCIPQLLFIAFSSHLSVIHV
jgi:hypothetical protein